MMFVLKMAPTTFQRVIQKIFHDYIPAFMQVFLDDFSVYGRWLEHLEHLRLFLARFPEARLSLNHTKCAFGVASGALLGNVVSREQIVVDLDKVKAILNSPTLKNVKVLSRFLRQIWWHSQMIQSLADVAIPLHTTIHKTPFNGGARCIRLS